MLISAVISLLPTGLDKINFFIVSSRKIPVNPIKKLIKANKRSGLILKTELSNIRKEKFCPAPSSPHASLSYGANHHGI